MTSRNHIVTKLMDMVPAHNKDGYTPPVVDKGAFILFALTGDYRQTINAWLISHSVYGSVSTNEHKTIFQVLADGGMMLNLTAAAHIGTSKMRDTAAYFKVRVLKESPDTYKSILAPLILPENDGYLIIDDGEIVERFNNCTRYLEVGDVDTLMRVLPTINQNQINDQTQAYNPIIHRPYIE